VFGTGGKANVHFATTRFATSTDCIIIRPKLNANIDAGYVFQYFKGNMQVLEKGFKGAGLKHISKAYLSGLQIPQPDDLNDQKRIAHLIDKIERMIASRNQHLQQFDGLLKSIFFKMFGDPVRNEKGWMTKPLMDLATIERGRFSPRPRNDPKFYNGAYPFIQTGDISRSEGRLREYTQTLNELGIKVSKEFKIGTIVIAIVGATIGETAILEIPTYAPDSVIGITPKTGDKMIESIFVEFLLRFWKPVLKARAPDAARANINIETLRPLPIIQPQGDDRKNFVAIVEKVESLKSHYQQSLADLKNLYGALNQKAFNGELDLSRVPIKTINVTGNLVAGNVHIKGYGEVIKQNSLLTEHAKKITNAFASMTNNTTRTELAKSIQKSITAFNTSLASLETLTKSMLPKYLEESFAVLNRIAESLKLPEIKFTSLRINLRIPDQTIQISKQMHEYVNSIDKINQALRSTLMQDVITKANKLLEPWSEEYISGKIMVEFKDIPFTIQDVLDRTKLVYEVPNHYDPYQVIQRKNGNVIGLKELFFDALSRNNTSALKLRQVYVDDPSSKEKRVMFEVAA
jgi:type I restriction enzyme S subunit